MPLEMGVSSRVDDGSRPLVADLLFLLSRRVAEGALDAEQGADEAEGDLRALGVGIERLEEVPPGVRPAVDLDDVPGRVQVVVDDVGIGDEKPLVAGEHVVDGVAGVVARELEEHVAAGRDQHPEVTGPASLLLLNEHAGRVHAEVGLLEGVNAHRSHQRLHDLGECAVPAAHRRARQLETVACVHVLEPMKRQMILPALDDGVGEHPGSGQSARNRQL
jgi:hypothetical protein